MFRYSKTTQCAVAAMSRLAEVYDGGHTMLSSVEIAESRNLSKPLVAKLLTILSQGGFATGIPGPGGGYCLARPPEKISLYDVASIFERSEPGGLCPFGPTWCGHDQKCPLHEPLVRMHEELISFLKNTTFAAFQRQ